MNNNSLISNYYSLHRDELVSFIAVRISDESEAADMVQDIFLRLLLSQLLVTPHTLPSLVYTMARHAVSDYYRRRHAYEAYEQYIKTSDIRQQTSSTEFVYSARELMERMERALARLPEACCTIYRLHIYDSMKVSDIAKELSLPYKQVENRLGQARKAVRQQLCHCI